MSTETLIEENAQLKAERLRLLKDYIADMEDTLKTLATILKAPDKNADALIAKARAVMSSKPQSEQKPDWSNSPTGALELWKSSLRPLAENLEIADGVIGMKNEEIRNLRRQLEARDKLVAVTEAAIELAQLKNIKESIEGWKHLVASGGLLAQEVDHANREIALMQEDYEARKEPAWEALRKALGELEEG